jgi:hypothetical protein
MPKNNKPFLNEGTVRRMMQLAEIESLSNQFVKETYVSEDDELSLDAEESEIEPELDSGDLDVDDVDAPLDGDEEVTLSDEEARTALDALKAAEPLIDKLEMALGTGEEGGEELPIDDDPELDAVDDAPVDDMPAELEAPGSRPSKGMYEESNEDSLYEAALKGLNIDLTATKPTITPNQLEEVKKAIYKQVVSRLVQEAKSRDK